MTQAEANFLRQLEHKAEEQRRLVGTEILPSWAKGVGEWLVVNPWRVLVPMAGIMYFVFRTMYGSSFREFILGIFGGF